MQEAAPAVPMVRICDDTGCSWRPKDAISTETVDDSADRQAPGIARLKQIAQTEPKAAYDLGLRYFRGDGVRQDSYQALVWMRKAAERGNLQAQKALGGFYLFGLEEMGPDPQEAEKWLLMAIGQGDKESKKLLEQARAAKKSDQKAFDAYWRPIYSGYWYSGYPYYGVWRQTYWYGY
ncbi:MAG: sel1 repeat family protein [Burkholderiaceae bacterium]|nr:sel1 repeat family protein [Burkholderiaceae bacterium]